jgi:hypothetical protein
MSALSQLRAEPKIKHLENLFNKTVELAMEKAAGHIINPSKYPLPVNANALEKVIADYLKTLPKRKRDKFTDKFKNMLGANSAVRKQHYGDIASVNLTAASPIVDHIKTIKIPDEHKITKTDITRYNSFVKPVARRKPAAGGGKITPRQSSVDGSRLVLFADKLVCNTTSEFRRDEVSFASVVVDNTGNAVSKGPFFVDKFKKGESSGFGNNNELFSFDFNAGSVDPTVFPQSFAATMFLVEKDWIDDPAVGEKLRKVCVALAYTFDVLAPVLLVGALVAGGIPGLNILMMPLFIAGIVSGVLFLLLSLTIIYVLDRLQTDFSETTSDSITFNVLPASGEVFNRTVSFELGNQPGDNKGRYTADIRWEVF